MAVLNERKTIGLIQEDSKTRQKSAVEAESRKQKRMSKNAVVEWAQVGRCAGCRTEETGNGASLIMAIE
ncbi:uncharacterized protein N7518_000218 [Penicillium psychrosexuale]|uniref:uncharacterized protein n=1 Tax=Penicillium psychrosexuale TaxID=1002107 RepID=UPI002544E2A2|nr:uncharacterized protein N7518_000218 [Penicillium psychrosexuale]KAJ5803915.1 hypothetical protein N7518_000218 [Penicillium psychrosexuale]